MLGVIAAVPVGALVALHFAVPVDVEVLVEIQDESSAEGSHEVSIVALTCQPPPLSILRITDSICPNLTPHFA